MSKLACLEVSRLVEFFAAFWSHCDSIAEAKSNPESIHLNGPCIHTSLGRHKGPQFCFAKRVRGNL